MSRYKNNKVLKIVGARIKNLRESRNLEIEDMVEMTGFSYNTIYNIENGGETYFSYFLEVCFALDIHPKDLLNVDLSITPRFDLSPTRIEKSRLTNRVKSLIDDGFFKVSRRTSDVVKKLKYEYCTDFESKNVSTILSRFAKNNILVVSKKGHRNFYQQ